MLLFFASAALPLPSVPMFLDWLCFGAPTLEVACRSGALPAGVVVVPVRMGGELWLTAFGRGADF